MKIWEIKLEEGRQYEVVGDVDKYFDGKIFTPDRFGDLNTQYNQSISEICTLRELINLEFEEVVNWSKVPVDTKVLVSDNNLDWHKRYFSEYIDCGFYAFADGKTSWNMTDVNMWRYCKLAED